MDSPMTRLLPEIFLALLLVSTPLAASEAETPGNKAQLTLDDLRTFTDVFNHVRVNFIEETDDRTLLNSAIRGMLSELDPHSAFLEPDELRQLDNDSQGRYAGIGVELSIEDGRIKVVHVKKGGAAASAGIVGGDMIIAIEGTDVRTMEPLEAIDRMRGEAGSTLAITIEHTNGEVSSKELTRAIVDVASVFSRPVDQVYGYFQITHFTRKTSEELLEQIEYMQSTMGNPMKGLVLDLRGNPGGVLNAAVEIADGFLDGGVIVSTSGRSSEKSDYRASPGSWLENIPMVLLVDGDSASASEVLAGALQDHNRALVLGERTFGKGSIQSVFNLRNGSGIRLTTALYYTPSGRSIQAEGVHPDIEISTFKVVEEENTSRRESDLERHLESGAGEHHGPFTPEVSPVEDYAMYQALVLLKGAGLLSNRDDG
jgi:carboxyl-terminal processing protease